MADTDDNWADALSGENNDGPEEARLIRAVVQAHEESVGGGIASDDMDSAKDRLMQRLQNEAADDARVVGIETHSRWNIKKLTREKATFLMAASAAIVAIGVMTLGGLFPQTGDFTPEVLMYYGELDTIRGDGDEHVVRVAEPDVLAQRLARNLLDENVPFELSTLTEHSTSRQLRIQVDGITNPEAAWAVLNGLGVYESATSVVVVNLVAEE